MHIELAPLWRRPWAFVACLLAYVGFVGPTLISATSTVSVLAGLGLLILLAAWGFALLRRVLSHKE